MATTKAHGDFIKSMDKMDEILSGPKSRDIDSVCQTYAKIRPILKAVLPILEKIPVVGKIAAAVRLLMLLADSVCKI
jgi:hypothetical protein